MPVNKIGILYHPMIDAAGTLARELEEFLGGRGVSVWLCSAWEEENVRARVSDADLVLTIGGDGTILRAAQAAVADEIPIVGINMGKLGFMTELSADEAMDRLPALLNGEGWIDRRATLEAHISEQKFHALNDVVVARGAAARTISVRVSIDGEELTTYRSDGVILATATGSTGYSMAAGGPILHPQAEEFVLVPIVPHLSLANSLVLPSTAVVELHITAYQQATLSIDGHINPLLSNGADIKVGLSARKACFLRIHPEAFYGSLEHRLKGKR